jgi:GNAT superfamily N-acetyltransferase/RimJ/RimL family protein N-acetyltransferase
MHRLLRRLILKSGEEAEIWKITAPDKQWGERLLAFLEHKGEPWLRPMRLALAQGLDGLTMNFYECVLGGRIIGNITVVESLPRPVALLQHVYTLPEHRRKGVASALMEAVCRDFRLRGGRAMYLGTGYRSVAYWIYRAFGFRSIQESGHMRWLPDPGFLDSYFAPGPAEVRRTRWEDWPLLEALYATEAGWVLRSFYFRQFGQTSYEGLYLELRQAMDASKIIQCRVMVKPDGAVVGHAFAWRQDQYPDGPLMLEFFVHPNFYAAAPRLLNSLFIPPGRKVQAVADDLAIERQAALEQIGLRREATLRRQFCYQGRWYDVHFYCCNC